MIPLIVLGDGAIVSCGLSALKAENIGIFFMVELGDKKKHAHTLLPSEPALRVKAIETLLV